ncbi:phenylacetate-CoA oxygenase subunit PaaC [Saprospiraceae bacterium]|nr:phenylacetate-CoA oxygenase subunit PaaC [Saprospiraceae bacterium]
MALKCDQLLHDFILQLADNALILGHRISEWCGHGPQLEQDIALSNIALDHVGQARMYYQLAASLEEGATEDTYPYTRDIRGFKNLLILEQENRDFGYTLARSFYYDHFHVHFLEMLKNSGKKELSEIAAQAVKEVRYHCRYSADWIKRLGDGTEESHQRIQKAIDDLYMYTGEFFIESPADVYFRENYKFDITSLEKNWRESIKNILSEATLQMPEDVYPQRGGKTGFHTEKLGFVLSDLQFMQRAYPNMEW